MKNSTWSLWISVILIFCSLDSSSENWKRRATFAGGCYWCMEEAFEKLEGVLSVTSGFEGDIEAVDIQYDPQKISYESLLEAFWKNIDPTDSGGQFCDRGPKYRSVIFHHDETQRTAASSSKENIAQRLNRPVYTQVVEATLFSVAPEEDQDYYKKDPARYNEYKTKCGRARRLQELWRSTQ